MKNQSKARGRAPKARGTGKKTKGKKRTGRPARKKAERRYMSVAEAGEVIGIGRQTAYRWYNSGKLPRAKIGGKKLVPIDEFNAMLEASKRSPWADLTSKAAREEIKVKARAAGDPSDASATDAPI